MKRLRAHGRGFSLIEVLVALVIIGVGMLGIAKIQALAYASTGTASLRSLAAIEASSLAAAMRANRSYWSVTAATATQTITITGPNVTASTDPALTVASNCLNVTCATQNLAAYDLQSWAASINTLLPAVTATVICVPPVLATYPIGCNITLSWNERNIGLNAQSQGTNMALPTYTLYVEP
jgi:type IV pilus assembly protein PilV